MFYFEQKTAYERRISDWSSDVCSSDLLRGKADGICQIFFCIGDRKRFFGKGLRRNCFHAMVAQGKTVGRPLGQGGEQEIWLYTRAYANGARLSQGQYGFVKHHVIQYLDDLARADAPHMIDIRCEHGNKGLDVGKNRIGGPTRNNTWTHQKQT